MKTQQIHLFFILISEKNSNSKKIISFHSTPSFILFFILIITFNEFIKLKSIIQIIKIMILTKNIYFDIIIKGNYFPNRKNVFEKIETSTAKVHCKEKKPDVQSTRIMKEKEGNV